MRHINWLPCTCALIMPGIQPATKICALDWYQTQDPSVCKLMLYLLSQTGSGQPTYFHVFCHAPRIIHKREQGCIHQQGFCSTLLVSPDVFFPLLSLGPNGHTKQEQGTWLYHDYVTRCGQRE